MYKTVFVLSIPFPNGIYNFRTLCFLAAIAVMMRVARRDGVYNIVSI